MDITNTTLSLANTSSSSLSWSSISIYDLTLIFAIFSMNATVLFAYVKNQLLRTNTFSYYLINLMVVNLFHAVVYLPLDISQALYNGAIRSTEFCSGYIYVVYIDDALMMQSHALITLNRVWAVAFPHTYRQKHSPRVARSLCCGLWVYVHVMLVPLVLAEKQFRTDTNNVDCSMNFSVPLIRLWHAVIEVIVYIGPVVLILAAYPFIWWKCRQMRGCQAVLNQTGVQKSNASEQNSRRTAPGASVRSGGVEERPGLVARAQSGFRHSFVVLTLLTASVLICWMPLVSFYTIVVFTTIFSPLHYKVGLFMWGLEPILDPLLFSAAFVELRTTLIKMFRCST